MSIKQKLEYWQTLWQQGSQLILLRLRLLQLDANEQLNVLLKIIMMLGIMMVLGLIGLIAMLFGLNALLPEQWKIYSFFGITVVTLVMCVLLVYWIFKLWQQSSARINETLYGLQNDLRILQGQKGLEKQYDSQ